MSCVSRKHDTTDTHLLDAALVDLVPDVPAELSIVSGGHEVLGMMDLPRLTAALP